MSPLKYYLRWIDYQSSTECISSLYLKYKNEYHNFILALRKTFQISSEAPESLMQGVVSSENWAGVLCVHLSKSSFLEISTEKRWLSWYLWLYLHYIGIHTTYFYVWFTSLVCIFFFLPLSKYSIPVFICLCFCSLSSFPLTLIPFSFLPPLPPRRRQLSGNYRVMLLF